MTKKSVIEFIKMVIVAVLFLSTILLLYLCFTQDGRSISIAEILGGKSRTITVNPVDYLLPEYYLEANEDGRFILSFENKKELDAAFTECCESIISSSTAKLEEIGLKEFEAAAKYKGSIISVYKYGCPFEAFSTRFIEQNLGAPLNCNFNCILFSDLDKESVYLKGKDNRFYKVISGENYYSIDRLAPLFVPSEIVLDAETDPFDYKIVTEKYKEPTVQSEIEINNEEIAKNIFGETFDFVRRITDSFGNQTYMYGYGQKRLSFNSDPFAIEFKEDISKPANANFENDLKVAILFIANAIENAEDEIILEEIEYVDKETNPHYKFIFSGYDLTITTEVIASQVSYCNMVKTE